MTLEISDKVVQASQLKEADIRLEFALTLYKMSDISIKEAKDLAAIDVETFKKIAIERGILHLLDEKRNLYSKWKPLSVNIGKFPKNLKDYALQPEFFEELSVLFEDAPSAEEMCKMLTP